MALVAGGERWTHAELIAATEGLPGSGTLGIDGASSLPVGLALAAVAVRPLLVGKPTVVLRHHDRDAAAGERVTTWL
jgi:hypothetical protein